jgi:hypothetical protein
MDFGAGQILLNHLGQDASVGSVPFNFTLATLNSLSLARLVHPRIGLAVVATSPLNQMLVTGFSPVGIRPRGRYPISIPISLICTVHTLDVKHIAYYFCVVHTVSDI